MHKRGQEGGKHPVVPFPFFFLSIRLYTAFLVTLDTEFAMRPNDIYLINGSSQASSDNITLDKFESFAAQLNNLTRDNDCVMIDTDDPPASRGMDSNLIPCSSSQNSDSILSIQDMDRKRSDLFAESNTLKSKLAKKNINTAEPTNNYLKAGNNIITNNASQAIS